MSKTIELPHCLLSNFSNLITVRLDDTNYVSWRFMLESMLVGCDLMGYIDGSVPCPPQYKSTIEVGISPELTQEYKIWRQHDSALMTLLAGTLSSDALSFIIGSKTSKEVWFSLEERYAKLSKFKAFDLKISMQQIQKGNDSIDKYMQRIKTVRDQLFVAGVHIPDDDIVTLILNGLPVDYATIKIVLRACKTPTSLSELRAMLLDVESDITEEPSHLNSSAPITATLGANTETHTRTKAGQYHCGPYGTHPTAQVAHQVGYLNSIFDAYKCFNHRGKDNIRYQNSGRYYYRNNNTFGFVGKSHNFGEYNSFNGFGNNDFEDHNGSGPWNGFSKSLEVCQICNNKGHIAQFCSQRSSPRQIVASGSIMQCQICMKSGHSAAECLHRHNYNFQPASTAAHSTNPLPVGVAPQLSISTQPPLLANSSSMAPALIRTSNHNTFVPATPVPSAILEWQPALLKEIGTLATQRTWQASRPMKLWRSMPMIPSG